MGSKPEARQDNGTRRTKAELAGRVRGGGGARPVGNGFRGMNHQGLGARVIRVHGCLLGGAGEGSGVPPSAGEAGLGQPGFWVW